jgi:hypothetical protein
MPSSEGDDGKENIQSRGHDKKNNIFPTCAPIKNNFLNLTSHPPYSYSYSLTLNNNIMAKNRNYHCKDVDMLMASRTIAESFRANISELSATRTVWTEQYATDLVARIDNAITGSLGIDAKKDLRGATAALVSIQMPAKRDVSFFKLQVSEDFKKDPARRDEILNTLGFTAYLRQGIKPGQEALVQLLYDFKTNMTGSLRQEITGKGINPSLVDNILGYAETYRQANLLQESLKGSTKIITGDLLDTFNGIYNEIIGICKIASAYYRYEPIKKERFSFSKVLANMGGSRKISVTEPAPVTA